MHVFDGKSHAIPFESFENKTKNTNQSINEQKVLFFVCSNATHTSHVPLHGSPQIDTRLNEILWSALVLSSEYYHFEKKKLEFLVFYFIIANDLPLELTYVLLFYFASKEHSILLNKYNHLIRQN